MSEVEFSILDECYFVVSYSDIESSVDMSPRELKDGIRSLLKKDYLQQLAFDKTLGDFNKVKRPDLDQISDYSYLATKEGLLAHNT